MAYGNNYTTLGLHNDGDNHFEAPSIHPRWPDMHNNPIPQTEIFQSEEAMHLMLISNCEMENILAARASNAHTSPHTCSWAPPELITDFSTFEEAGAHYNGVEDAITTNLNDLNMPSYVNPSPSILDGFANFEPPRFEESAEMFRALNHCAPDVTDQLADQSGGEDPVTITPNNRLMEQTTNDNVALSPIQTGDALYQPDPRESSLQAWSIGSRCTWPECTSRAVFKTFASFNMHLTNVHTHPLLCSIANCQHQTPFGRLSDLRRHQQSAHTAERKFVCSVITCNAAIKEFSRKDHLVKHRRERHVNYFCPINHCARSTKSSFDKSHDVLEHITAEHGSYECALKACSQAPSSQFDSLALLNHLRNHHAMPDATAANVKERMENRLSNTVTETDLGRASCGECKTCAERNSVTKEKA